MKTDAQLQIDVMQELKWNPSVTHEYIGVSVSDGVVTLSGTVPSYAEKRAAEKTAQRVAGVKAVVEKIEVKLPGMYIRGDQEIAKAIASQFKWSIQVPEDLIKVSVQDGWVDLSGEVEWDFQRRAAEKVVRALTGVRGVSNLVSIKATKIDSEVVKKKIEEALKREAKLEAKNIDVEVRGNKVILSGNVHSLTEANEARWAAWSAPGVVNIESNLRVSN